MLQQAPLVQAPTVIVTAALQHDQSHIQLQIPIPWNSESKKDPEHTGGMARMPTIQLSK
jgi:hypothetical protein